MRGERKQVQRFKPALISPSHKWLSDIDRWHGLLCLAVAGVLLAACAGGMRSELKRPLSTEPAPGGKSAAMAVVRGEGARHWGLGIAPSEQQAAASAIEQCADRRCTVVQTYTTGQCAAVVLGRTQVFWGGEDGETTDEVLSLCEAVTDHCEIKREICL